MPVPFLAAVALAFVFRLPTDRFPLGVSATVWKIAEAGLLAAIVGWVAVGLGRDVLARAARANGTAGRRYVRARKVVDALGVAIFALILYLVDWVRVVDHGLGLRRFPFVEEAAILAPYMLAATFGTAGLHRAAARVRPEVATRGLARDLFRRARKAAGVALPIALIGVSSRGLFRGAWRPTGDDAWIPLVGLWVAATAAFLLSPAFVRLAWPMQPMPPGALRDRLERLARRLRFRCSDILVWDTNGTSVNAAVTGVLPWFRYVIVTDAMAERLPPEEIEAVFGHEVGHAAHRHLPYYAAFFFASAAVVALGSSAVDGIWDLEAAMGRVVASPALVELVAAVAGCLTLGLYFFLGFGGLSRRFERQADLYGARSVSCGLDPCDPQFDPNAEGFDPPRPLPDAPCPRGVRLLAGALIDVAVLNGIDPADRSWRHGTIADRVASLGRVLDEPGGAKRFQEQTARLRWAVLAALAVVASIAGGVASGLGP